MRVTSSIIVSAFILTGASSLCQAQEYYYCKAFGFEGSGLQTTPITVYSEVFSSSNDPTGQFIQVLPSVSNSQLNGGANCFPFASADAATSSMNSSQQSDGFAKRDVGSINWPN